MKYEFTQSFKKLLSLLSAFLIAGVLIVNVQAAKLSPTLQSQIANLSDNASVGVVIICFNTQNGLTTNHLSILRNLGINTGVTYNTLGMVGAVLTKAQVNALAANPAVRSIWSNDRLAYTMRAGTRHAPQFRRHEHGVRCQRHVDGHARSGK